MSNRNKRRAKRHLQQNSAPAPPSDDAPQLPPGSVVTGFSRQQITYSGPIPPPQFMREYEEIIPGSADRILAMAEAQTSHRIELESKALTSGIHRSWGGLVAAFIIGMTAICFGGTAMLLGHSTEGFWFGISGLAALVGLFITGKYLTASERIKKNSELKRQ